MCNPEEILYFIHQFRHAERTFTDGCCYWFAYIMQARFGADILYLIEEGHFVARIKYRLYDVTGDVTDQYSHRPMMTLEQIKALDELWYDRIVRDCIKKLSSS